MFHTSLKTTYDRNRKKKAVTMLTPAMIATRTKAIGLPWFTFADGGVEGHYSAFIAAKNEGINFFPGIAIPLSGVESNTTTAATTDTDIIDTDTDTDNDVDIDTDEEEDNATTPVPTLILTAVTHDAYLEMMNSRMNTKDQILTNPHRSEFIYGFLNGEADWIPTELHPHRLVNLVSHSVMKMTKDADGHANFTTEWETEAEKVETNLPKMYTTTAQIATIDDLSTWLSFKRIITGTNVFVSDVAWIYSDDDFDASEYKDEENWVTAKLQSSIDAGTAPHMITATPLSNDEEALRALVHDGWLRLRKGTPLEQASLKRIDKEMSVICDKNFTEYFTNVYKFIAAERELGVLLGPGRGSATGSEVLYMLGISHCDPLRYGLFFERFLNKGRSNMPDIDWDSASTYVGPHGEEISKHNAKRKMKDCWQERIK